MDIIRSTKLAFAYTIKHNTDAPTAEDYIPFFEKLEHYKVNIEYKISELDSKGRLHYHGIIYLTKGFYRKKLCVKGLHVKLVEIYDKSGWTKYIHKDCVDRFGYLKEAAAEHITNNTVPIETTTHE